jgi:predicted alpha/beta-fold hydrolase
MRTFAAAAVVGLFLAPSVAAQSPKSQFFTASDGTKIHYFEIGGKGTPVVLIHGYTANAEGKWLKSNIAQTLAKNHRVIAIDARGHGRSDKPHDPAKYGPRMATDVIESLDHLEISRAHVHGYSMGGSILTQLLARRQDRLITAIYGGSGPQETDPKWIAQVPKNARTRRLERELKGAQIVIIPGETHGSVHLNPTYTSALVKFIDAHDHN